MGRVITLSTCIGTDRPVQIVKTNQMPQNMASDQDLHSLQLFQQFVRHINRQDSFKFYETYGMWLRYPKS